MTDTESTFRMFEGAKEGRKKQLRERKAKGNIKTNLHSHFFTYFTGKAEFVLVYGDSTMVKRENIK